MTRNGLSRIAAGTGAVCVRELVLRAAELPAHRSQPQSPTINVLHNKALHQTRRGGVLASRAGVEARLAGEGRCSTDIEACA